MDEKLACWWPNVEWEICNRLTGAFNLYDIDGDGSITKEEMFKIVDAIYRMVVC